MKNWDSSEYTKKTKTGYSTAVDVLETPGSNSRTDCVQILNTAKLLRSSQTPMSSVFKIDLEDGKIHTTGWQIFKCIEARLSMRIPNLANLSVSTRPSHRKASSRRGKQCLLSSTYQWMEPKVAQHISGDEHLIDALNMGQISIHRLLCEFSIIAKLLKMWRRTTVAMRWVNFGVVYEFDFDRLTTQSKRSQGLLRPTSERSWHQGL